MKIVQLRGLVSRDQTAYCYHHLGLQKYKRFLHRLHKIGKLLGKVLD